MESAGSFSGRGKGAQPSPPPPPPHHEALALAVAEDAALAARPLGDEAPGAVDARRVELDELEVLADTERTGEGEG